MDTLRKFLYDSGIFIAIITAVSYFCSYSYQKGYLYFFGIENTDFIEINLNNVIKSFAVLISLATVIFLLTIALSNISLMISNQVLAYGFLVYMVPWILTAFGLSILVPKYRLWTLLGTIFIGALLTYLPSFDKEHNKEKYIEKLRLKYKSNTSNELNLKNIKDRIKQRPLFLNIYILLMVFIIIQWVFAQAGIYVAKNQKEYLTVTNKNNDYIVIKKYSDQNILLVSIDPTDKEIMGDIIITKNSIENSHTKSSTFLHMKENTYKGGIKSDNIIMDIYY